MKNPGKRMFASCLMLAAAGAAAGLLEDMGINGAASRLVREQDYAAKRVGKPPAQHAGAEGVPPLPLPAVPLRRTEKKNPPRPPVLIAKLATSDVVDWATSPKDADNLLKWMAQAMNVHFSTINLPASRIPTDVARIPVLYRSGIRTFEFSGAERQRLRSYLLGGGTLVLNAYCGHPDFARSALAEMQKLLPERPPYRLSGDHPLYRSYYAINDIRYRRLALEANARNGVPSAIGIDINTRTAVFLFRYDLSTAWDDMPSNSMHIIGYDLATAKKLGANLMAYITAERTVAIPLSKALVYVDADRGKSGKFAIAEAMYDGLWKTRDVSLSMLLNVFHSQTRTPVRFEEQTVALDSARLFELPVIYLTGQMPFELTPTERQNLRNYLIRGGVLIADACCGRPSFDESFRHELQRVLPNARLERLPEQHRIFQFPHHISKVVPRPALARRLNAHGKIKPLLYGVTIDGRLAVIYSPYDLSGGWALAQGPYNQGIESTDALGLGVNILANVLLD